MSAKDRLSENEKRICYFLKELGVGRAPIIPSEHLDMYNFYELSDFIKETVPILEHYGFVSFKNIFPFVDGYAEDVFFKNYLKLLKEGKKDEADKLANLCNFPEMKLLREGKLNKNNIDLIGQHSPDASFGQDVCSCVSLDMEISQKLIDFVAKEVEPEFEEEPVKKSLPVLEFQLEEEPPALLVKGVKCPVRKFSRQYEFLKVISSNPQKDWQFSEIGEKLDFAEKDEWKKLHNVALALKGKIAVNSGQKDFFITTTQSVKINPAIFEQKKESSLDDF